jgi:hypothetical protein
MSRSDRSGREGPQASFPPSLSGKVGWGIRGWPARRTPHPTLPHKGGGICYVPIRKSKSDVPVKVRVVIDWRGWLSLAWMVGFGVLYVAMILREKAPGLLARISRGG